ncbi:MAG: family 16 glycosylhydrolase [Cyclobacteriaceae bacterium]
MINKVYYILICSWTMLTVKTGLSQPTPVAGTWWEPIETVSDEFDSWNPEKWHKPLWDYPEPNKMLWDQAFVEDGKLIIKAGLHTDEARWMKTSRVQSNTQISYPVYIECSMKTSGISALNTFWLNNGNGEARDEIDVCENNAAPLKDAFNFMKAVDAPFNNLSAIHVVENFVDQGQGFQFDNRNLSVDNPARGKKWDEIFHTIGVFWKDERHLDWYVDGEKAGSTVSEANFTRDLSVIFDLWTTQQWGIATKESVQNDDINEMQIDWVRAYRLEGEPIPTLSIVQSQPKLYPNPVSNGSFLRLNSQNIKLVECHELSGRPIPIRFEAGRINVSGLRSGIYIFTILGNNGESFSQRITIK